MQIPSESGILTREQAAVMDKMAKFRNIVVHQYEAVDAEIVVLVLRRHLSDFELFSKSIVKHMTGKE